MTVIFIIFTEIEMLDLQSLENIVYFLNFFFFFVAANLVWPESCTPIGDVRESCVEAYL